MKRSPRQTAPQRKGPPTLPLKSHLAERVREGLSVSSPPVYQAYEKVALFESLRVAGIASKSCVCYKQFVPKREWEKRFPELKAFRRQYGHCKVPPGWPANRLLAKWLAQQQFHYDQLPLDRLRRLFDLGFQFGGRERHWLAMYFGSSLPL